MTTFHATDPRTGRETGPEFAEASAADVRAAVRAAGAAAPAFAAATPTVVSGLLDRIAAALRAAGAEIIAVADAETALGERRLTGELERTCGQLELFARTVRAGTLFAARESTAASAAPHLLRVGVPIGPVAVFAASNFPLAFSVAGGDTASAFAARCPVVVKAHPAHPRTSATVGAIVAEAIGATGLPAGIFNLIQGRTPATSTELAAAPEIAAIAFTGSQFVGRTLYDLAATRPVPVPVYAEMGSLNPVVVTPAALRDGVDETAQRLAASALDGWGQFCTKPGLIAVPADRADAFTESLVKYMSEVTPGYLLSPGIRAHLVDRVARLAALENVDVRTAHPGASDGLAHPALVLTATAGAVAEHEALREETFGPVTMVVPVAGLEEAIGLVGTLPGSLTGTVICATDGTDEWAAEVAAALIPRVGRLVANGVPTGVAVVEAQHHGGPYPATAMSLYTSVGTAAVERFLRPVALQNVPAALLPPSVTAWLE